jgi:Mce-associated membrane protein
MDAHRNSAAVMVYINRTVSDKSNRDQPIYDGARLRVEYKRIEGKWLINYITPI